jgi:hypothetical protein
MQRSDTPVQGAVESSDVVRVSRAAFDADGHFTYGHLLDFSARFLYITVLADHFELDGYQILYRTDVTLFDLNFPNATFYRKALAANSIRQPEKYPPIDLSDIQSVLRSVQENSSLVTIERERVVPGECEIGRLKLSAGDIYALRWLSPAAEWEDDFRTYKFADVTRVSFGGKYEATLAKVAGLAS